MLLNSTDQRVHQLSFAEVTRIQMCAYVNVQSVDGSGAVCLCPASWS